MNKHKHKHKPGHRFENIRSRVWRRKPVWEYSNYVESMWPSRINSWRFFNQPLSSTTASGLVHIGRSYWFGHRHRNNLPVGLWCVNHGDCSTSWLRWKFRSFVVHWCWMWYRRSPSLLWLYMEILFSVVVPSRRKPKQHHLAPNAKRQNSNASYCPYCSTILAGERSENYTNFWNSR